MTDKTRGLVHQGLAYLVALVASLATAAGVYDALPRLGVIALADVVGTVTVFGFSRLHDNTSLYDPYWSVAPIVIASGYLVTSEPAWPQWVVVALVVAWGIRLTCNFLVGWPGIHHEDWRYRMYRERFPRAYWWISFFGLHLFPTVLVYLGCLALHSVFTGATLHPLVFAAGVVVTVSAIGIESVADAQLRSFVRSGQRGIMDRGLWRYSRHPNYFGEVSFWWGLWICGAAIAGDDALWTLIGPVMMTLLFVFISIPMLDKRSLERRPGYADHMKNVSALVPWFRKD